MPDQQILVIALSKDSVLFNMFAADLSWFEHVPLEMAGVYRTMALS